MKRILVVEDEDAIREFVVINLQRAGYDVVEANSGEAALQKYEENHGEFDVAILDIMMPGIDGLTVCKELRKKSGNLGIIMLTAKTQEMDKVTGLMLGADDYVTKPFSPSELVARVDSLYRRVAIAEMREENNFQEELVSGDGSHLQQSRRGSGSNQYFNPCLGRSLLRGRKNCRRKYPPPANENRGRAFEPQAHRYRMGVRV